MPIFPVARQSTRLNAIGGIVALVGLSVALFIAWHAPDDSDADDDILFEQTHSKAYDQAVQRNVGSLGLLESQWWDSLGKLGRPRPLAATILVVSGLTAGCFFLAASRQAE